MRVAASLRRPNFAKLSSAGVTVPVDSAKGATTFGTRPRSTTTRLASTESTAHSWPRTACQQRLGELNHVECIYQRGVGQLQKWMGRLGNEQLKVSTPPSYSKASRQSSYFTPPYFSYIRACCALATVLRLNEFKIRTKTQIEGHVAD